MTSLEGKTRANNKTISRGSLEAKADRLLADDYRKNIERIYLTQARFINLGRIYSATGKCMNVINVASLFYSIMFPEQNYGLIFSIISFSLQSMFNLNGKSEILERLISMYRNKIIPEIEKNIRIQISNTVEFIKKSNHNTNNKSPDSKSLPPFFNTSPSLLSSSPSTDYIQQCQKINDIINKNYAVCMGEGFTLPISLEYTNYRSIIFCISLYLTAFVAVPTFHFLRWW